MKKQKKIDPELSLQIEESWKKLIEKLIEREKNDPVDIISPLENVKSKLKRLKINLNWITSSFDATFSIIILVKG